MTDTSNRYLTGNFAPVRDEVTARRPARDRHDPRRAATAGCCASARTRCRTGPAPGYHWFTGTGMVHGVRLRDGRAEWYRNRCVRSDRVASATAGPRRPARATAWATTPPTPT